jgi:hypothetical protein
MNDRVQSILSNLKTLEQAVQAKGSASPEMQAAIDYYRSELERFGFVTAEMLYNPETQEDHEDDI